MELFSSEPSDDYVGLNLRKYRCKSNHELTTQEVAVGVLKAIAEIAVAAGVINLHDEPPMFISPPASPS